MAEGGGASMTRQELMAFAQKLEEWGKGLSEKEQSFLEEILGRAVTSTSGEVEGFMTKTLYFGNMPVDPDIVTSGPPESWDWGNLTSGRFSGVLLAGQ